MDIPMHHAILCRLLNCLETQSFHMIHLSDYFALKDAAILAKETIIEAREMRRDIENDKTLSFKHRKKMKAVAGIVDGDPKELQKAQDYLTKMPRSSVRDIKNHLDKSSGKTKSVKEVKQDLPPAVKKSTKKKGTKHV